MNFENFLRCPQCKNGDKLRPTCKHCHFTGLILPDGRPASVKLGENEKWQALMAKESLAKKKKKKKSFFFQ